MKKCARSIIFSLFIFSMFGCVAYKVNLNDTAYKYRNQSDLVISEKYEGIPHCGFAQIMVITAGVIPSGCNREYVATTSQQSEAEKVGTVSYLQGWITLFLTPFSSWSYQWGKSVETEIVNKINEGKP